MPAVDTLARTRIEVLEFRRHAVRWGQLPWSYLKLRTLRLFRRRRWGIDRALLAVALLVFEILLLGGKARRLERRVFRQAVDPDNPLLGAFVERKRPSFDHHAGTQQLPAQVARQVRPVNDHQDLRQVFAPALCNTSVHVPTLLVIIE